MNEKEQLEKIEKAIEEFKYYFVDKYFKDELDNVVQLGEITSVGSLFLNFYDMYDFVKYDYSKEEIYDYCDYRVEQKGEKKSITSIKDWKKNNKNNEKKKRL